MPGIQLPIDTAGITCFVSGTAKAVVDYETKVPKVEDGHPVNSIVVTVIANGEGELITVKVAGPIKAMAPGTLVRLVGLGATPWSNGAKSGVSFRATRIEEAGASGPSASAASGASRT